MLLGVILLKAEVEALMKFVARAYNLLNQVSITCLLLREIGRCGRRQVCEAADLDKYRDLFVELNHLLQKAQLERLSRVRHACVELISEVHAARVGHRDFELWAGRLV